MKLGRSGPRSKNGCWTCRSRKVKCDESRPVCSNCDERGLGCDYAPRIKPKRRRREGSQDRGESDAAHSSTGITPINNPSVNSSVLTPTVSPSSVGNNALPLPELPFGLTAEDWPIPLTSTDCQAIRHYADDFVRRMVLKTSRWSSYSFLLLLCTKHALLAHLVLAFSVRDMAKVDDNELNIAAIEHYRKALAMFIEHLGSSGRQLWLTFPALWLFIHYEQQYGDDPRALQRHLEGVRDIVASHGSAIFPGSIGGFTSMNVAGREVPRHVLDRLALWTIYHDAAASTFSLGGSLVRLLIEEYPGSITRIRESSCTMLKEAWGEGYPPEEELWDLQIKPLESLVHETMLLRYELAHIEKGAEGLDARGLINIGRELKRLQEEYSSFISTTLSRKAERSTILSNMCVGAASLLTEVIRYERIVYEMQPLSMVCKTLQICASLHEYEGERYMWRVAWPLFVAGAETDDPIHQAWILDRFNCLAERGENMRRAKVLLEAVFVEQRQTRQRVDYLSWIRSGLYEGFVI